MRRSRPTVLCALVALLVFPVAAGAIEVIGRISGDVYTYKGTEDHTRPYLRFRGKATVWRATQGRFVRLHTSLRWTDDFASQLPSDPELFVYDAYVQFQNLIPRTGLYAGRQFVYSGVGSALMDGARFRIRPYKHINVEAFGGSSVSSEDPETVRSIDEHLVAGARISSPVVQSTRLGLGWMLTRRDGHSEYNRIGIDASHVRGRTEVFGRGSYNAVIHDLAELQARVIYRPEAWYFSGEYQRREPSVAYNSIFAVIDFYRYEIARVEARRRVWRQLSLVTHAQTDVGGQSDAPWRIGAGIRSPSYSLIWVHQAGNGGENDGVSGYATRMLTTKWNVYASANLFRYRVQLEQMERSDSYASTVGLRWRPGRGFTIAAEGQYMRNAIFEDDGRFLLRVSKDFAVSTGRGKEER